MKHISKKVSAVCLSLMIALTMIFAVTCTAWAAEEGADLTQQMIQTAEGLTDTVIPMTDDQINSYMSSGDPFTVGAMTSWLEAKDELGAAAEGENPETKISLANGEYTVTVTRAFEKHNGEFVFVFEEGDVTPQSMVVNAIYPMSVLLQRAGLNTAMGIGIVFLMLIFLSFVIWLFRFIPNGENKKKAQASAPVSAPAPAEALVVEDVTDDTELIAVIAAAIAAAEGSASTDGFVVRSIRKINRKKR